MYYFCNSVPQNSQNIRNLRQENQDYTLCQNMAENTLIKQEYIWGPQSCHFATLQFHKVIFSAPQVGSHYSLRFHD